MKKLIAVIAVCALAAAAPPADAEGPVGVVAAENFYGDIARQIGGTAVAVTSILANPDQDPHLFEASPATARAVAGARLVIYNGIDYDPWMAKLLGAARGRDRKIIVVAPLTGGKAGDNPHIWYDPRTMTALAAALATDLAVVDPAHQADYRLRLVRFEQSVEPIEAKIASLRWRFAGTPVTATEPIFGYMFAALGLHIRNERFQLAVMNNTEPAAADVAAFEDDLRAGRVRMLVYNSQASDPVAARMRRLAEASHIPVVGATETEPPGKDYQAWMMSELDAVDRALSR